jgi:hypothetical protein
MKLCLWTKREPRCWNAAAPPRSQSVALRLLSISFVAGMLTDCASSQRPIAPLGAMSQRAPVEDHAEYRRSWMRPGTKNQNLLYASTPRGLYVLSYPKGRLVGEIDAPDPAYLCADKDGDVFLTQYMDSNVLEYAHGGTEPVATLSVPGFPWGCSVDPATKNLAVMDEASEGAGNVAIFDDSQGTPTIYSDPDISFFAFGGYDDRGNLFVDGDGGAPELAELPKGSGVFVNFALPAGVDPYSSLQWDGKYITLANGPTRGIYRLKVSGSSLTTVGVTRFKNWRNGDGKQTCCKVIHS